MILESLLDFGAGRNHPHPTLRLRACGGGKRATGGAIALYTLAHDRDALYAVSVPFGFSYGGEMPLFTILMREHFPAKIMGSTLAPLGLTDRFTAVKWCVGEGP